MNMRSRSLLALFVGVGVLGCYLALLSRGPPESVLHPTTVDERRLTGENQFQQLLDPRLNVLVFGMGNAYGAALDDRMHQAFPYLLSQNVDNYAHPVTDNLNFYSTCIETVLNHEKIYHVIVLDFWLYWYLGMKELAHRLKERFPNAMIFLIRSWSPSMFRRKAFPEDVAFLGFKQWKKEVARLDDNASNIFHLMKALGSDTGHWYFQDRGNADRILTDIVEEVGGIIIELPTSGQKSDLMRVLQFYDYHQHLKPNKDAHIVFAQLIKSHVELRGEELVTNGILGGWTGGDRCELWYTSGMTSLQHDESLKMRKVPGEDDKFALFVEDSGTITVVNPFAEPRTLYLTYLASSDPDAYDDATASGYGAGSFTLDTFSDDARNRPTKTTQVGKVPGGVHTITISPIINNPNVHSKFGLVGASFTDEEAIPDVYGFGISFDDELDL
mmetsp:Transcript_22754/g.32569  ORF Transcript_22754/g.32569 Transcript_22754/m.32569 type:complete len:443 (+) Transcript_22754:84-1412(+)|eukprot:CAMPEP_0202444616 /NCGR_PEP_ID=MMETSP1360-20130828/3622_1 /ASSEMBLY_ACC=CAM_ASM_000848 /TAXON_ID=515479 /ORGANISM="Licmophora paradoxa, Strain CCMP2313" /LENGTH=442 /DNA_ID=CAMNT_0049060643 /DNA_START=24 /DNA_END=1352 /DNA_ORIENTATION=+